MSLILNFSLPLYIFLLSFIQTGLPLDKLPTKLARTQKLYSSQPFSYTLTHTPSLSPVSQFWQMRSIWCRLSFFRIEMRLKEEELSRGRERLINSPF